MKNMYIYSGKCRKCECGIPTNRCDINGNALYTGDIVVIFTEDYTPDYLTVMVSDQYQTYTNGKHKLTGENNTYPMGIKNVWQDPELNSNHCWSVLKVKSYHDVIDGEKWGAFGFNYKYE